MQRQDFQLAGAASPPGPAPRGGVLPEARRGTRLAERPQQPGKAAEHERLGQRVHRGVLIAVGCQRQRPKRLDLDDAAGAAAVQDWDPVGER